jgi:hypothetical protein
MGSKEQETAPLVRQTFENMFIRMFSTLTVRNVAKDKITVMAKVFADTKKTYMQTYCVYTKYHLLFARFISSAEALRTLLHM